MFVGELKRSLSIVIEGQRSSFLVASLTFFPQLASVGIVFGMTTDAGLGLWFELLLRMARCTFDFAVKPSKLKVRLLLVIEAGGVPQSGLVAAQAFVAEGATVE